LKTASFSTTPPPRPCAARPRPAVVRKNAPFPRRSRAGCAKALPLTFVLGILLASFPSSHAQEADSTEAQPPAPLTASVPTALDADSRFLEANAAFAEGRYDEAQRGYRALVEAGFHSPELYYNLGTTRYRQEVPGEAMLWLRRALVLDPGFDEARQNIGYLRARIPYLVFDDRFAERWMRSLRPGYGRWAISMCLWVALIAAAAPFALPRLQEGRGRFFTIAAVSLVFAAFFWRVQHLQHTRYAPEAFAIVTADASNALTAPAPDSREVIELPPGSEVRIVERSGAWAYLEIPGNLRGWVRTDQVEALWPVP